MVSFLAVSERYRSGFIQGHDSSHYVSLADAAQREGHSFSVAALGAMVDAQDPLVSVHLPSPGWETIAPVLGRELVSRPASVIVIYEGSLDALRALVPIARSAPEHVFVVNLFRPERPLNVPVQRRMHPWRRYRIKQGVPLEASLRTLPPNIRVVADTERRAFLARAYGLPVLGVWPLHSTLATYPAQSGDEFGAGHVLVAISDWQMRGDPDTVQHIESVLRSARRALPNLRFERLGSSLQPANRPKEAHRLLRRLPDSGSGKDGLPLAEYARRIRSSAVVWLPKLGLYTTQSSGKALDVLVSGRPLIAPSGTFGDIEQRRWVPGSPSYRSEGELLEVLGHLALHAEHWATMLARSRSEIIEHYSPGRTIRELAHLAGAP